MRLPGEPGGSQQGQGDPGGLARPGRGAQDRVAPGQGGLQGGQGAVDGQRRPGDGWGQDSAAASPSAAAAPPASAGAG